MEIRKYSKIAAAAGSLAVSALLFVSPGLDGRHLRSIASGSRLKNLVYYSGQTYQDLNEAYFEKIADSPFDGFAVRTSVSGSADFPSYEEFQSLGITSLLEGKTKKIWPQVNLNRLNVYCNGSACAQKYPDLWDTKGGGLTSLKNEFRVALKLAGQTSSPGIVIDPEMYADHENYKVGYIAETSGRSAQDVHDRLVQVGRDLADIANSEYPNAVMIFLFADLGYDYPSASYGYPDSFRKRSPNYIVEGMLEQAKAGNYPFKVVEGGEHILLYIHPNLEDLKESAAERDGDMAPYLAVYPDNFVLGGTAGLYLDIKVLQPAWAQKVANWVNQGQSVEINAISDFLPSLQYLFANYDYVWFYRGHAGTDPPSGTWWDEDHCDAFPRDCEHREYNLNVAALYRPVVQSALSGNGVCETNRNESCANNTADCGACVADETRCGNGRCEAGNSETCSNCEKDCGACASFDGFTPFISIRGSTRILSSVEPSVVSAKEITFKGNVRELAKGKVRIWQDGKCKKIVKIKKSGYWRGKIKTRKARTYGFVFKYYDSRGRLVHITEEFRVTKKK